jgi:hypothetical protein
MAISFAGFEPALSGRFAGDLISFTNDATDWRALRRCDIP